MVHNDFRYEYKYLLSDEDREILEQRLQVLMNPDIHADYDRSYLVRSLYFDDYVNSCYYDIEDGVDCRVKYRIRTYNCSTDVLRAELKRKVHDKNCKERQVLSWVEYCSIFDNDLTMERYGDVWRLSMLERGIQVLRPVIMVEYRRASYVYETSNVRITFDSDICSSKADGSWRRVLFDRDVVKRPVLPQGRCLLEVKFDNFIPDHIYQALSVDNLNRTAFSKYYFCRKFSTGGNLLL